MASRDGLCSDLGLREKKNGATWTKECGGLSGQGLGHTGAERGWAGRERGYRADRAGAGLG